MLAEGRRWTSQRQRQSTEIPERADLLQIAVDGVVVMGMQTGGGMFRAVEKGIHLRFKHRLRQEPLGG
ncbi:hypothetical protein D3C86_2265140 [compost metagenome]